MWIIIEAVITWFVGDAIDSVHARNAAAFWLIMAILALGLAALTIWIIFAD